MYKPKLLVFKIKELIIPFSILLFTCFLLVFSDSNFESCKYGIRLWANSVVPTLFPFFIATELLSCTNIIYYFGKLLDKLMRPVFNVPGISSFPLIMGIISGYPIGAKIVANLKLNESITNEEAERLISFTNNSGPLFIIGTVGIGFFKNINIGILLLITHILSSISVGLLFRNWKSNYIKIKNNQKTKKELNPLVPNNKISFSNLGEVLSCSIMNAINSVLLIGGFIVLFSVIISILENSLLLNIQSPILNGFLSGIIELTNGVSKIAIISNGPIFLKIIICSFLIGFGGLCVSLQILSIISKARISIKPYIIGKLLQGILAAVYTFFFYHILY